MDKQKKEPLIHITKRKAISKTHEWGIRLGSILVALIVCALITTVTTHLNPISVYGAMWEGSFGSPRKMWALLKELSILLMVSVALAPAFKMKFWNLGGGGQVMAGVLATATCMITLDEKLSNGMLILVSLIAALAAGALWAFIPAFCKAKWNTNETLFTLMMNYVATQIVAYYIIIWESPKGSGKIQYLEISLANSRSITQPFLERATLMVAFISRTGMMPTLIGKVTPALRIISSHLLNCSISQQSCVMM